VKPQKIKEVKNKKKILIKDVRINGGWNKMLLQKERR
jgi:hypothetical protein